MTRPVFRCLMLSLFLVGVGAVATLNGCITDGGDGTPVVIELKGGKVTLGELRAAYDDKAKKPGAWDAADGEARRAFLEVYGDKEVMVHAAREELGGLPADDAHRLALDSDNRLIKALEAHVVNPVARDTAGTLAMFEPFRRQVRLLHFASRSDSVAALAREEVVDGVPFEEVFRKYVDDPFLIQRGPELNWMMGPTLGAQLAEEIFLSPREPGYLTEVRLTPLGYEFYRLLEFQPHEIDPDGDMPDLLSGSIRQIRTSRRVKEFLDSLQTAAAFEIDEEGVKVLKVGMAAYWDSLIAISRETKQRPREFRPPLWNFDAAQRARHLYDLRGRPHTIGPFLEGLSEIPPNLWPSAFGYEEFLRPIEIRIGIQHQLEYARAKGLDKDPEYVRETRKAEEKMLLDRFHVERVAPRVKPTKEEMAAFYEAHKDDKYLQREMIRLSYVVFPTEREARRFHDETVPKSYMYWGGRLKDLEGWATGCTRGLELPRLRPRRGSARGGPATHRCRF